MRLVRRPSAAASNLDRSLAGLHLLCAESFHITIPRPSADWSLAIEESITSMGASGALLALPLDAGRALAAAFASSALFDIILAHAHAYLDSPGRIAMAAC